MSGLRKRQRPLKQRRPDAPTDKSGIDKHRDDFPANAYAETHDLRSSFGNKDGSGLDASEIPLGGAVLQPTVDNIRFVMCGTQGAHR